MLRLWVQLSKEQVTFPLLHLLPFLLPSFRDDTAQVRCMTLGNSTVGTLGVGFLVLGA